MVDQLIHATSRVFATATSRSAGVVLVMLVSFPPISHSQEARTPAVDSGETKPQELAKSKVPFIFHRGVAYAQRDTKVLRADFYVPKGEGSFPAIVMIHGGAWTQGKRSETRWHARAAVGRNYVVMAIDYRLAPKYKFPAQIHDCKQAVRYLRSHAEKFAVDPDRVAAYGYSAGGHLAALLGVTDVSHGLEGLQDNTDSQTPTQGSPPSTRIQAVVAGGAPCDLEITPPRNSTISFFMGGTRYERPENYRRASPLRFVTDDDPPMFFFHGSRDGLVPRNSAEYLHDALLAMDIPSELFISQNRGHVGAYFDRTARDKAIDFLDHILKPTATERP